MTRAIYGRKAFTDDQREALMEQIAELRSKYPQRVIAWKLGISQSTVVRLVAEARETGLIDEHDRYLAPERRAELVEDLSHPGWNLLALARKYGITKGAVYYHASKHGYVTPGTPREQ